MSPTWSRRRRLKAPRPGPFLAFEISNLSFELPCRPLVTDSSEGAELLRRQEQGEAGRIDGASAIPLVTPETDGVV